jgi:predicted TIM-barrel fold metal-dependent hydrolase
MIMIIDVFCHHISRRVGEIIGRKKYYGEGKQMAYPAENADVEVRLSLMDKYGIDVQALSQTTPVLMGFGAGDAAEICRLSNDDNFNMCRKYPDRFVNICIVSLTDVKGALNELERCVGDLDCRGVTVSSNIEGKGLDLPEFFPLYEKLEMYDLPLLIHPTHWETYPLADMDEGWRLMQTLGWPFDTSQAMWRIIMGGVLDRYPALKIVTHHMGAMFPYFSRRIEGRFNRNYRNELGHDLSFYLRNFYGDTATDGTTAAYPCGYAFFGADRLMYGSDYPFGAEAGEDVIRENLNGIRTLDVPPDEMEKILGGNAKKLLKIG